MATDFISDIRIKFNQLSKIQINKMPKSIINDDQTYSHVRLLQINGTTAVCGNGQL